MDRRTLLLAALGLANVPQPGAADEELPLRLAYFDSYAPFAFRDRDGAMTGVEVRTLDIILVGGLGLTVEHQGYPWARAQEMVETGAADGFCTAPTPERSEYAHFSRLPVFVNPSAIVYHSGNPRAAALAAAIRKEDLSSFTHVNYIGNGFVERLFGHDAVVWAPTPAMALLMIERGHADYMMWAALAAAYEVHRLGLDHILVSHPLNIGPPVPYHFGLRRSYPGCEVLMVRFDNALVAPTIQTQIAEILRSYAYPEMIRP